jgi:hypothetical protein
VRGRVQRDFQCRDHSLDVGEHLIIPEPDNSIAVFGKATITLAIGIAVRVLSAIHFDNQPPLSTDEIDKIRPDRLLADELAATDLPAAELPP